jgi:hypothetical protein
MGLFFSLIFFVLAREDKDWTSLNIVIQGDT